MTELSLHVLDIAQNSIRANATRIEISVLADTGADSLEIAVSDNGRGMTPEQMARVEDPFFTTRTTRKVGMGISLFKMAAQLTGGGLAMKSEQGKGTALKARFVLSHIDRMPLGDMNATVHALITMNPALDFVYTYGVDGRRFVLDTGAFRQILGDIPFDAPEVSRYIREYLEENKREVDGGMVL